MAISAREAVTRLTEKGFVFERTRGSHHIYKHPSGLTFSLPFGGKHRDLSNGVEAKLNRTLLLWK